MRAPSRNTPAGLRLDSVLDISAFTATAILLSCIALRCIWGADFWWQYKTGEYVATHGIPSTDVFSYTMSGQPWIELRWIYCLLVYGLTELFGFGGPVVLKWIIMAAVFTLVARIVASRQSLVLACAVVMIAMLAASQRFFVRPELLTYLFFALYLWIIDRFRKRGGRILFLLLLLQVVWTNSHTLFILGPVMVGILLFTVAWPLFREDASPQAQRASWGRVRTVGLVLVGTTLACLVNPYGPRGFLFPFLLFIEIQGTAFKEGITEFHSPFAVAQGYTALVYYKVLIALCVASAVANWRRLDPFWTNLCLSQFFLSALAIRNLSLFSLAAIPFVIFNLRSSSWPTRDGVRKVLPLARRIVALAVIAAGLWISRDLFTNRFNLRQHDTNEFGIGLASHRYPVRAVAFMREHQLSGPIFHSMSFGAYLLAQGYPVFIDPRLEVYGEGHFERFLEISTDSAAWEQAAEEYGFQLVLVEVDHVLPTQLRDRPDWTLLYFDEVATLYGRSEDSSATAGIRTAKDFAQAVADLRDHLPAPRDFASLSVFDQAVSPSPYRRVASFLFSHGLDDQAEPFLRDAIAAYPPVAKLHYQYGRVLEARGDAAGATREFEAALRYSPDDPTLQLLLARDYFRDGRLEHAKTILQRLVDGYPDRAVAWALLGKVYLSVNELDRAAECTRRALDLDPSNTTYIKNLAYIEIARNKFGEAIALLTEALSRNENDFSLHADLAHLYWRRRDLAMAEDYMKRALALNPADPKLLEMKERLTEIKR